MIKLAPIVLLLASPVLSDFTVPVTMQGVSTGSLDVSGNIVSNVDRILSILNQFHAIVENLYYVQSPELTGASDNFRYVMDSLVEAGSPVFQGLSNVAKVSSGDVKNAFNGIRADINAAVRLNTKHLQLVNQTRFFLGEKNTAYFDGVLNQLASNLGNITQLLNNIQKAVLEIQKLNPKTQASMKALLPNDDIKALNAVLRQYILIGDAAVPQVRAVANGVRMVDNFLLRLDGQFNLLRQNLDLGLSRISDSIQTNWYNRIRTSLSAVRNQFVTGSTSSQVALTKLLLTDPQVLGMAANRTLPVLQALAINATQVVDALSSQDNLRVETDPAVQLIFNYTESDLIESSFGLVLAVIQQRNNSNTCYYRYNAEFDKIPRSANNQLYACALDKSNYLSDVAQTLGSVAQLANYDYNYDILAVQRCTAMITNTATEITKYQAATCLDNARSFLENDLLYGKHVTNFEQIMHDGLQKSNFRYESCLESTLSQTLEQIGHLDMMTKRCLYPEAYDK